SHRLGTAAFYDEAGRMMPLERWIPRAVFYLLMLFVVVGFFDVLELKFINEPLNRVLQQLIDFGPQLIPPAILIFVAWIVASLLRMAVIQVLGSPRLRSLLSERVVEGEVETSFVRTMGNVVYWVVFLIFSLAILDSLHLEGLLGPL